MYVELDHDLVPGKIEDINVEQDLAGGKKSIGMHMKENKYHVQTGQIQDLLKVIMEKKAKKKGSEKSYDGTEKAAKVEFEAVAGTSSGDLYYDKDLGFFSAVLACYNNHWVLRTRPDDWWNIIVRNVAQMVDDNGDKNKVRDFFVSFEGKRTIKIMVPTICNMDYSWVFDQFSKELKENIKTPGYVDIMQADFSTTTPDQLISTQIMLMSSLQKYFNYVVSSKCGIPGVEMTGTLEDWLKLIDKTENLKKMLQPIMDEIGLARWFSTTLDMLRRLVDTQKGGPDKEWWGHILSWNCRHGSGARSWWSGWMIDFLMPGKTEDPQKPNDFPSGVVSVPLKLEDSCRHPPLEGFGELVAGTVGYTVEEGDRAPVVQARQGWVLLLPKGSPLIARIRGED